ncbi:MAG: GNAT family N-acetyltransferase [Methanocorpusculum sp.]|uniref:GNAT family N-acetyltransferase n=1 Tax=Methanocorpusculum sp. TaxID=2058474 RepID=UPI002725181B|nr:GNAT family N-acetyltransferase [Methanocorpusculum sp.]MDO9522149.1 GNAT family N-acetyltransferase [Methanocorpusculum sp.]
MQIETQRLKIIPLDLQQFSFFLKDKDGLEKDLGLKPSGVPLDVHTKEAMTGLYAKCTDHDGSLWFTYWMIISREHNTAVGGLCFMGEPLSGVVEVGYGIDPGFQHQGFMTETLSAVTTWALSHGAVCVTAETEKDNPASQKVLTNSGFQFSREEGDSLWWVYHD